MLFHGPTDKSGLVFKTLCISVVHVDYICSYSIFFYHTLLMRLTLLHCLGFVTSLLASTLILIPTALLVRLVRPIKPSIRSVQPSIRSVQPVQRKTVLVFEST